MSVCFRVDASPSIGVGHLMRCLALAQILDEQLIEVYFFIRQTTRESCLSRHDWVGRLCVIPHEITQEEEAHWVSKQVSKLDASLLVVDGYQFHHQYRAQLQALLGTHAIPLALFDDTNSDLSDSGLLHADIVINSAPDAARLDYNTTAPQAKLCLGSEYRLLRQEFYVQDAVPWEQRHGLTLVMGGSDVNNLTIPLLEALETKAFSEPVRVLTGSAYPFAAELKQVLDRSNLAIQHLPRCQTVAEVFSYTKLVVSAAGSTQFELLACGTPAILATVANNQLPAALSAQQQGWCRVVDCRGAAVSKQEAHTDRKRIIAHLMDQVMDIYQNSVKLRAMLAVAQQNQASQLQTRYALIEQLLAGE